MKPKRHGKREWTGLALAAIASTLLLRVVPAQGAVMAPIVGEIERISLDNPADVWSGGRIVVGGDNVVIPRNLLIDLPANRLTLQQLFAQAPPSCLANGETGLAKADRCNIDATGGLATIFANRTGGGDVIAGDVRIAKAVESVTGTVTYVSYTDGYFRLNGIPGDNATGVMVRVNDPSGRHTIQQGLGCAPGNTENCSADRAVRDRLQQLHLRVRDGVPAVHPERGQRGERRQRVRGTRSARRANRPGHPSPDSTRFAPVVLGDNLSATGNFERVGGVQFLSAHTVKVFADVTTQNLPTQPDYVIFTDVGWDAPAYPASRVRARFIGATTLHDSQVDIFSVHYDTANVPHEIPLETTVNNVNNAVVIFLGVPVGVFQTRLDVDFFTPKVDLEPCPDLLRGGVAGASALCGDLLLHPPSLLQNFRLMSPVAREVVGRTRHKATLESRGGHAGHPGEPGPQRPVPDAGGDRVPRHGGDRPGEDPDAVQLLGRAVEPGPSALPGGMRRSVRGDAAAALSVPVRGDRPADAVAAGAGARSQPDPVVLPVRAVQRPGVAAGRPRVDRNHPRRSACSIM